MNIGSIRIGSGKKVSHSKKKYLFLYFYKLEMSLMLFFSHFDSYRKTKVYAVLGREICRVSINENPILSF
jgi:hypothetical protein